MIPTILPKVAPIAIDGTKIPAGTLHPYVMTTRPMRIIVARSKELEMRHWAGVLYEQAINTPDSKSRDRSLTGID